MAHSNRHSGALAASFVLLPLLFSFLANASEGKSIYRVSTGADLSIISIATLGYALPNAYESSLIDERCPCDPNEVNSFDRPVIGNANAFLDNLSDVTAGASILVPLVADWADLGWKRELGEDFVVYVEVLTVNGAVSNFAKFTAQRPRPRTYAGDSEAISSPKGYQSFYSGHTTTVFAALSAASMTLNYRYHSGIWPWLVTTAVGVSVAAERVASGQHFYTDVMMGAAAGTLIGVLIPLWHARSPETGQTWQIRPAPVLNDGAMVAWIKRF